MSVYLARTLLLSLGISIFVTVCFYALRKDLKMPEVMRFSEPKETFATEYTIRASGYPAETALQQQFKNDLLANITATAERLDKAAYDGKVSPENDSSYKVSVKNITDTNAIRDLVSINSNLSFNEVYTISEIAESVKKLPGEWTRFTNAKVEDTLDAFFGKVFQPAPVMQTENYAPQYYPHLGYVEKANTELVFKMLADPAVLEKFPANIQFSIGDLGYKDELSSRYYLLYALKKNFDPITKRNIKDAHAETDELDQSFVAMEFDAAGARRWERITEKNAGRAIAISLNNKVIVAPHVLEKIVGGHSRLSMSGEENCRVISVLLTSKELKLPVQIIQSQVKKEEKFSLSLLTGYTNYILFFVLSFAISFCVIWFVFRPGKKLSRNA